MWEHLPFVQPNTDPATKREESLNFWSVQTTADYLADHAISES